MNLTLYIICNLKTQRIIHISTMTEAQRVVGNASLVFKTLMTQQYLQMPNTKITQSNDVWMTCSFGQLNYCDFRCYTPSTGLVCGRYEMDVSKVFVLEKCRYILHLKIVLQHPFPGFEHYTWR